MGASCDPSDANQSSSAQLAVRSSRTAWQCERGCNLCLIPSHFGITFHNRVIISSLSLPRALPLSLAGITGTWGKRGLRVWGAQTGPIRSRNRTHTRPHTSSFRSIKVGREKKKRERSQDQKRAQENRSSPWKSYWCFVFNVICLFWGALMFMNGMDFDIRQSDKTSLYKQS